MMTFSWALLAVLKASIDDAHFDVKHFALEDRPNAPIAAIFDEAIVFLGLSSILPAQITLNMICLFRECNC
jgi:hypothetical protein